MILLIVHFFMVSPCFPVTHNFVPLPVIPRFLFFSNAAKADIIQLFYDALKCYFPESIVSQLHADQIRTFQVIHDLLDQLVSNLRFLCAN